MKQNEIFGQASWLGFKGKTNTPYVRSNFVIENPKQTKIYICGLGFFYLYINGKLASEDIFAPVRSDYIKRNIEVNGEPFDEEMNHRIYVMEYDITNLVLEGENSISISIGPGFYDNEAWSYDHRVKFGDVRLIYRIVNEKNDGTIEEVLSNDNAKFHTSPIIKSDMYKGEEIDFANYACDSFPLGPINEEWENVEILENLDTEYYIQTCPNDRKIRTITPVLVKTFGDVRVYDIKENTTGWVVIKCKGKSGDKVYLRFGEELNATKALDMHFIYNQTFTVTLDGKTRLVHPYFVWYGFRYFSVEGDCEIDSAVVIHSNIQVNLDFECSNKTINWLYNAYIRSQLSNMHSGVPSDCPHIERRGYTGDGQLCARASMQILHAKEFYKKWIDDILDCQDRNSGHVQYTAPYQRCGGGPGGWGIAIITVPYEYYQRYGEKEVLEKAYPQMLRYLEYLDNHSENNLVISDRKGSWCLGDWCAPNKTKLPEPFVNTYFHIKALILIEKIELILGLKPSDVSNIRRNAIVESFNNAYYDENSHSYLCGIQGADAFAIDIGLGDEKTLDNLINKYEKLGEYDTGIFGTEIVTRVLLENNAEKVAYELLTSNHDISFESLRKAGATTLWEYWPGEYERSHNHPMFGGVCDVILPYIVGIKNIENKVGYREIEISPKMVPYIKNVKCKFETDFGTIDFRYSKGIRNNFYITLPKGIKALFKFENKKQELFTGENVIII